MINKNTSIKRVIAKVLTDHQMQEGDHRISDLIEYAAEGLEKIGAYPYFIHKVSGRDGVPYLELTNYQLRLPIDFHKLISIAYSESPTGPFYPMRYASGILGPVERINANLATPNTSIDTSGSTTDITYIVTDGWIKTNIADGYLSIAYQAIPIDGDGYPMVPDDPGFIEALYWYITMKLLYPQWRDGRIRDAVYFDAKQSWQFYCKQAYGNAMMPNLDQLKTIKNAWLRLIPDINEHDNYFETLGQQEFVYNHSK